MKVEQRKKALLLTQKIMEQWYQKNDTMIRNYLSEDASWIGAGSSQVYEGKQEVLSGLNSTMEEMKICRVSEQNYLTAATGEDFCIVMGTIVTTLEQPQMLMREPQRLTFVWKQRKDDLRLIHMHVSNNAAVVAPDEEFPLKASRTAFHYIYQKLSKEDQIVSVCSSKGVIHRISRDCISYLEADNEYILIHCNDQGKKSCVRLHRSLTETCRSLFPEYLVIHRSYCVNPSQIRAVEQYQMRMLDGEILPISRKRYAQVCNALQNNN